MPLIFRGQRAVDQPGVPDRGRIARAGRLYGGVLVNPYRLRCRDPFQTPIAGKGLDRIPGRDPQRPDARLRTVLPKPGELAGRLRAVQGIEIQIQRRPLSRVADRAGPADAVRPSASPKGLGEQDRSGALRAIPFVPAGQSPESARSRKERAVDWRPAFLRFSRLERRLGQPGAVSAGRTAPPAFCGGICGPSTPRPPTAPWPTRRPLRDSTTPPTLLVVCTAVA